MADVLNGIRVWTRRGGYVPGTVRHLSLSRDNALCERCAGSSRLVLMRLKFLVRRCLASCTARQSTPPCRLTRNPSATNLSASGVSATDACGMCMLRACLLITRKCLAKRTWPLASTIGTPRMKGHRRLLLRRFNLLDTPQTAFYLNYQYSPTCQSQLSTPAFRRDLSVRGICITLRIP